MLKPRAASRSPASREPASRRTVAIIGTGLIGASIGLALRRKTTRVRIIGWDRRREHARAAKARGALHEVARSLQEAVADADIIILAVPLATVVALLPRVMNKAPAAALVMDVAGLKQPVIAAAERAMMSKEKSGAAFVGGHPLAGSQRSGPQHATSELFQGRPFALCAPRRVRPAALQKAAAFARMLGARPIVVSARNHDRIVAATSGLPQIASSALALAVGDAGAGLVKLVGPGYDSTTRLALSGAGLWTGSLLANRKNICRALAVFEARVRDFAVAIEQNNPKVLSGLFRSAATQRRRLRHP